MSNLVLFYN